MCGIAVNICHLLSKGMESWQTILISKSEELVKLNIQSQIFQRDNMSHLLYLIGWTPLSHILRKVNAGYQLGKGKHRKINQLLVMNNLKLYGNNQKEAERLINTVRISL